MSRIETKYGSIARPLPGDSFKTGWPSTCFVHGWMLIASDIAEDMHVNAGGSGGRQSLETTVQKAVKQGLRRICLVQPVDRATHGIAEFAKEVRLLNERTLIQVSSGVETSLLNEQGELDLPASSEEVDHIFVGARLFPLGNRSFSAAVVHRMLRERLLHRSDVIASLFEALAAAVISTPRVILSSIFSHLPELGVWERDIPLQQLNRLARIAAAHGAMLEVNETDHCPSVNTAALFYQAGVPLVYGSGAGIAGPMGRYYYNELISQEMQLVERTVPCIRPDGDLGPELLCSANTMRRETVTRFETERV